ncbi:MAG: hypothetical protein QW265_04570 [Candidatus Bathyarchaeia archaeon]
MSEVCRWLHEQLEQLPMIKYTFKLEILPENGDLKIPLEEKLFGNLTLRGKMDATKANKENYNKKIMSGNCFMS